MVDIHLTIDGNAVCVAEGTTIMKAARQLGIEIPHLCYLEGINEISACKVCVVEMKGKEKLITACNNKVEEGMVLYTNSPKVRNVRKNNVQLILSQHDCHCATCVRSGNCPLQTISNDLGILEIPFREEITRTPWNQQFPLIRDSAKCIKLPDLGRMLILRNLVYSHPHVSFFILLTKLQNIFDTTKFLPASTGENGQKR